MGDHFKRFRQAQSEYERELALGGEPPEWTAERGSGETDATVEPEEVPGALTPPADSPQ